MTFLDYKEQAMGSHWQALIFFLNVVISEMKASLTTTPSLPMESGDLTGLKEVYQFIQTPVPSTCKSGLTDITATSSLAEGQSWSWRTCPCSELLIHTKSWLEMYCYVYFYKYVAWTQPERV